MNDLNRMVLASCISLWLIFTVCPVAGAAETVTQKEETTSSTVVSPDGQEETRSKNVTKETTVEKPRPSGPQGILGKTFVLLGDIVAFPFKAFGYILGAIF